MLFPNGTELRSLGSQPLLCRPKISYRGVYGNRPLSPTRSPQWNAEAVAKAAQAKVLSGSKLEQRVVRLKRRSGNSKEGCLRFIIQHRIKGRVDHRRWTEAEFDLVRVELVKRSVEEVAEKVKRIPEGNPLCPQKRSSERTRDSLRPLFA